MWGLVCREGSLGGYLRPSVQLGVCCVEGEKNVSLLGKTKNKKNPAQKAVC